MECLHSSLGSPQRAHVRGEGLRLRCTGEGRSVPDSRRKPGGRHDSREGCSLAPSQVSLPQAPYTPGESRGPEVGRLRPTPNLALPKPGDEARHPGTSSMKPCEPAFAEGLILSFSGFVVHESLNALSYLTEEAAKKRLGEVRVAVVSGAPPSDCLHQAPRKEPHVENQVGRGRPTATSATAHAISQSFDLRRKGISVTMREAA